MASVAAASDGKERPKVLVLGGVGTIGRVFIQHLVEEGLCSKIRVVDKALPITAYCSAEHEAVLQNEEAGVEFCQADLSKDAHVERAFTTDDGTPFDFVFNLAAETRYGLEEDVYKDKCLGLSTKCATAAKAMGVQRFVEVSTGQVYASQSKVPAKEAAELKPWTIFAKYKLLAEQELLAMEGLSVVILRLPFVYGRADTNGLMPRIVTAAAYKQLGETMKFLWGSSMKINTVHVTDVVRALWHCATSSAVTAGSTFNVVDKGDTDQGKISAILGKVFGIKTGFHGKIVSNLARMRLGDAVDQANEKHLEPWHSLLAKRDVGSTPLTPYMHKELLANRHLYMDGSAIEATGFSYTHPGGPTEALIRDEIEYAVSQGIFPGGMLA